MAFPAEPRTTLKQELTSKYGSVLGAASALRMSYDRLCCLISGRLSPNRHERKMISESLAKKETILFPKDSEATNG